MRVGRGDGSGWGGTAGRGHKGQRSRSGASIRHHFEGGQTPTFRRLPKVGFKSGVKTIFNVVNLAAIEKAFEAGAEVDETSLRMKGVLGKAQGSPEDSGGRRDYKSSQSQSELLLCRCQRENRKGRRFL